MSKDRAIAKFLSSTPWAIRPEALDVICQVVLDHMDGKSVLLEAPKAKVVGSAKNPEIAIIPIHGTIAKKLYGLGAISGGRTTIDIQNDIQQALNDPSIEGIILDVDSPGGTVDGTKELSDFIYGARGHKPIITYANGLMASAAYWIGSSSDKIVAFPTSQVGSIGVIVRHMNYAKALEMDGVEATHIFAGKYKAYGNQFEALSSESKDYMQGKVDYYYSMFVEDIARNRNVDTKTVLEDMAEGRIFIGNQAKKQGLVDEIGNLDVAIQLAKDGGDMNVKEAVEKFNTKEILSALMAKGDLPESVSSAIESTNKPQVVIPAEVQAQLDAIQEELALARKEKEEAQAALLAKEEASQKEAKQRHIIESLGAIDKKLSANEEFVSVCLEVSEEAFATLTNVIGNYSQVAKESSKAIFKETDGATSTGNNTPAPESFDAAMSYIANRDNIPVEEAGKKAKAEFPELFNTYINGGN